LSTVEANYKKYALANPLQKLWSGHLLNKTSNLSQASLSDSSTPCTKVVMVTFTSVFLDGKKNELKSLSPHLSNQFDFG